MRSLFSRSTRQVLAAVLGLALVAPAPAVAARPANVSQLLLLLNGKPKYLGTIDVTTTSKTNAQATTAFGHTGTLLKNMVLLIQCDAAGVRIHPVAEEDDTVTTNRAGNHGVELSEEKERIIIVMDNTDGYVAAIIGSGTANCDFWRLL